MNQFWHCVGHLILRYWRWEAHWQAEALAALRLPLALLMVLLAALWWVAIIAPLTKELVRNEGHDGATYTSYMTATDFNPST